MKRLQLECGNCGGKLSLALSGPTVRTDCNHCWTDVVVEAFPALLEEKPAGRAGEDRLIEGESGCFYHPEKKAVIPCAACGRFLCSLCDIEFGDRHLCPKCLESGASKGTFARLKRETVLYDEIAIALAVYPMLIFYFTLLTAPAAIYYSLRHWNKPLSVIPRSRWRFAAALGLAGLQVAAWAGLFTYLAVK